VGEHVLRVVLEALFGVFDAATEVVLEVGAEGEIVDGRDGATAQRDGLFELAFCPLYPPLFQEFLSLAVELKHPGSQVWMGGKKLCERVTGLSFKTSFHQPPFFSDSLKYKEPRIRGQGRGSVAQCCGVAALDLIPDSGAS
jgi:hypothetical protein